jgi:hypothetical protein
VLVDDVRAASGVAIDATHVVYSENVGNLKRVRKDGTSGSPTYAISNEPGPHSPAIAGAHVYWVNGCGGARDSVRRIARTQIAPSQCLAGSAELLTDASVISLDQNGTWVYFADHLGRSVERVWRNGGLREPLAEDRPEPPNRLVADRDGVYWVERFDLVMLLNHEATPRVIPFLGNIRLSTDAKWIYFTESGSRKIRRVLKEGVATPIDLTDTVGVPGGITRHDGFVYWTENRGDLVYVQRVAVDGGAQQTVMVTDVPERARIAGPIAVDDDWVRVVTSEVGGGLSELWSLDRRTGARNVLGMSQGPGYHMNDVDTVAGRAIVSAQGTSAAILVARDQSSWYEVSGSEGAEQRELVAEGNCVTWVDLATGILKIDWRQ